MRSLITDGSKEFPSIDMNTIKAAYEALFEINNAECPTNVKQPLKNLLLQEIPELEFDKRGPKPEVLCSKTSKDKLIAQKYEEADTAYEMEILFKASTIVRREIEDMEDWQFTGSFTDFETPQRLFQLMKWITCGPSANLNVTREIEVEKPNRILAQHIISSYKTKRQVTYEPKTEDLLRTKRHR